MDRWVGKVAVVTGASSGIGEALVQELVELGVNTVGLARRQEKLDQLAETLVNQKGKFYPFVTDITKEQDILKAFQWIKENVGVIHILVNNAGINRMTTLIDGKTELWKDVFDTNVMGLCIATREAVKEMRANNVDGHIVHINSVAGHTVLRDPTNNVYCASKYAVTALTETLRNELTLVASKIKITSVSPGFVMTGIFEATAKGSGLSQVPEELNNYIQKAPSLTSKDVADSVIYVLSTPPHVQVHELTIKPVG